MSLWGYVELRSKGTCNISLWRLRLELRAVLCVLLSWLIAVEPKKLLLYGDSYCITAFSMFIDVKVAWFTRGFCRRVLVIKMCVYCMRWERTLPLWSNYAVGRLQSIMIRSDVQSCRREMADFWKWVCTVSDPLWCIDDTRNYCRKRRKQHQLLAALGMDFQILLMHTR